VPTRILYRVFAAAAIVSFLIAIWDLAFGGFHFVVLGVRLSSREAYKPLAYGELCAALAFVGHDIGADERDASWSGFSRRAGTIAAAVSILFVILGIRYGIYVAGGADYYGYVSQAALWASGHVLAPDTLSTLEPLLGGAVAPLGYRLAHTPGYLAPIYSPGLPLAMAALERVGLSVYLIVPLMGGAAVWLTYRLTSCVADRRTGCIAAVLLAFSPIAVFLALVPMSDVPVTAWWLLAWLLTLSAGPWSALMAGLASSAAILTRPNIVPLALVTLAFVAVRSGLRRGLLYAAGVLPSALFIAGWNQYLYGSPVSTGYGPLETLFSVRYAGTNLRQFWSWLVDLHTPVVIVGVLALVAGRIRYGWWLFAFSMVLLGCYLFYLPFDNWTFLRFLMPAIPLLLALDASVCVAVFERLPMALRGAAVFALCTLVPFWFVAKIDGLRLFEIEQGERRYETVGEAMKAIVPPDAVLISMIHSGSVRLYGDRHSIRWDLIAPDRLDATLEIIRDNGFTPYFLLEDWEEPRVRDRFGKASAVGRLDWPPTAEYLGHAQIRLYSPDDRARYLHGEPVLTKMIPFP
jgi:hypothetical protein